VAARQRRLPVPSIWRGTRLKVAIRRVGRKAHAEMAQEVWVCAGLTHPAVWARETACASLVAGCQPVPPVWLIVGMVALR
jgi:hypothetical protein